MEISDRTIDGGKPFDFGKVSNEYALYRDIYPKVMYDKIIDLNLCTKDQNVLDIGTGTGVLPRNLYTYGAKWIGTDISSQQIEQAKRLSEQNGMDIRYLALPTEELDFPDASFDVITACQCFWYFDHDRIIPKLSAFLKDEGKLLIIYMAWLPNEDKIAKTSEDLVLKYNPNWSGAHEKRRPVDIPDIANEYFTTEYMTTFDAMIPFTRESWHGRLKTCRGIGASLSKADLDLWDREHRKLLEDSTPKKFEILHYVSLAVLKKKT